MYRPLKKMNNGGIGHGNFGKGVMFVIHLVKAFHDIGMAGRD